MARDQASIIPDSFSVRFRCRRCFGSPSDEIPLFYTRTRSLSQLGFNFDGAFGNKYFHDSALALYTSDTEDPSNKAALDSLAERIIIDHINWLTESFDESFPQVIAPILDSLTDTIEFVYRPENQSTRRYSVPYNNYPEEFQHNDPANKDCKDNNDSTPKLVVDQTPCIYFYGPPIKCTNGKPQFTRYKVCLLGGLLIQEYISTDTMT